MVIIMLEIKSFLGEWKAVTKEVAENFYKHFCKHATAIRWEDKQKYFNENHIRGGHVEFNGKIKIDEEVH
jgi:hypothetical protein